MAKNIEITLACGNYDIVRPLMDGEISPEGIDLTFLTDMDSTTRHWRFLRNREFDAAEVSASSYIAAKARGQDFEAIPVFLHRRFRHGFIYVNTGKNITKPQDLIGKRVGVKAYLVTAVLWMRGILEEYYGVPSKEIEWMSELDEDVDITLPEGVRLTQIPQDKSIETMLAEGEIDALLHPDLIDPILEGDPRVGRLFTDYKSEEIAYYQRTGIFPIMHVMGLKADLVARHPWVPSSLYKAFDASRKLAMKKARDPRRTPLAWYTEAREEQEALLGNDPWVYGLGEQNRNNIETLARYSHQQGVIDRPMSADDLFLDLSQGRKRGEKMRI